MDTKLKTAKQMERYLKGMANHHRINILLLVSEKRGITVEDITEELNANFKTISQHTRYLAQAELIEKQYRNREVMHSLSPYGKFFVKFIKEFQHMNTS